MLSRDDMHPYQLRAVDFIKDKKRAFLMLDLGLGKTVTTLTAISDLMDGFAVRKVLIIAPLRVANSVWMQEAARWEHLKHLTIRVCTGSAKQRDTVLHRAADVYVINRENVEWLATRYGDRWPFDCVVVDESSSFKNPSARRFKALRKTLLHTSHMILLSGTPSPNGVADLWAQCYLIDSGMALGRTVTMFRQRYFEQDYNRFGYRPRDGAAKQIRDEIAPFCLSMSAADYLTVPDKVSVLHNVTLPVPIMDKYQQFEKNLFLEHDGIEIEAVNAAVMAGKLLQYSSGAMYTGLPGTGDYVTIHDDKIDALKDIIEDNAGENILVAYSFKSDLERLQAAFPHARVLDKNPDTIDQWNNGEIPLLLAHPACLHPETEVLAEFRGWVKIVDVKRDERVFDGIEFVSHKGCSYSGVKDVIQIAGVTLTPNHKILVEDKWVEAKDVRNDTDFRRKARYTYSGNDAYLGEMLQLPKGKCCYEAELRQGEFATTQTLRRVSWGRFSPYDEHSNLADMATHGESGDKAQRPKLQALWGHWSWGVRKLVAVFKFLRGYARHVCGQPDVRQDRQHAGIFEGELPVGYKCCPAGEQVEQPPIGLHGCKNAFGGILPSGECFERCDNATVKQRYESRGSDCGLQSLQVSEEPKVSDVYDLVDCGPRSRFVIRNKEGDVFISHNSAGHGLNLQRGGAVIVWFSLPWSLEYYLQFNARLHRQGQGRPVRIIHIVCSGTIDETVYKVLSAKDADQNALLAALKESAPPGCLHTLRK